VTVDLLPTFLELAGLQVPKDLPLDGISILADLLKKDNDETPVLPQRPHEDTLFWGVCTLSPQDKQGAVMIEGRYKLIFNSNNNPAALYDLHKDPLEDHNILSTPFADQVVDVKKITSRYLAYLAEPRLMERHKRV